LLSARLSIFTRSCCCVLVVLLRGIIHRRSWHNVLVSGRIAGDYY
jgi:hypothetical protein